MHVSRYERWELLLRVKRDQSWFCLSLSNPLSRRKANWNRLRGSVIVGDVFLGGSVSATSMVVLLDGDGPLAWWFSTIQKVSGSCVIRFCMCLDYESYCSDRLFFVCYLLVRCIGGDRYLSRRRRSLPSFSSIRCIGGDGALLDSDGAISRWSRSSLSAKVKLMFQLEMDWSNMICLQFCFN